MTTRSLPTFPKFQPRTQQRTTRTGTAPTHETRANELPVSHRFSDRQIDNLTRVLGGGNRPGQRRTAQPVAPATQRRVTAPPAPAQPEHVEPHVFHQLSDLRGLEFDPKTVRNVKVIRQGALPKVSLTVLDVTKTIRAEFQFNFVNHGSLGAEFYTRSHKQSGIWSLAGRVGTFRDERLMQNEHYLGAHWKPPVGLVEYVEQLIVEQLNASVQEMHNKLLAA